MDTKDIPNAGIMSDPTVALPDAKALAAILPPKRRGSEDFNDVESPPGSPPQPANDAPAATIPHAKATIVEHEDLSLPSAVAAADEAAKSAPANADSADPPVSAKKAGGVFSVFGLGMRKKQSASTSSATAGGETSRGVVEGEVEDATTSSAGAETASAADTNQGAGGAGVQRFDPSGDKADEMDVVAEEVAAREEDDAAHDDELAEEEGAYNEPLVTEWMQGKSKLDADWRLAAFLSVSETAVRAVKASRVSGPERVYGTVALCQVRWLHRSLVALITNLCHYPRSPPPRALVRWVIHLSTPLSRPQAKGTAGERPTSIYFIADSEVDALANEMEEDVDLERRYAASNGSAEVPFGHPHQVIFLFSHPPMTVFLLLIARIPA